MAFAGGVFSRLYNWVNEGLAQPVEIAKLDAEITGIATGLSTCILRDGTGVPTADTPWNSKKITGLAAPTALGDALSVVYTSATLTLTGVSGSVTGTGYFAKAGNLVVANLPQLAGTSNTTAMTITGLPAAYQPSGQVEFLCIVFNSGSPEMSLANVSGGTITLYRNYSSAGFTASGVKGFGFNLQVCVSWYAAL